MENKIKVLFTTFSNKDDALKIGEKLVKFKLSFCVQLIPKIISIYSWKGKIQKDNELLLIIKYINKNETKLIEYLKEHHPYEIPELICTDFEIKNKDYIQWFFSEK